MIMIYPPLAQKNLTPSWSSCPKIWALLRLTRIWRAFWSNSRSIPWNSAFTSNIVSSSAHIYYSVALILAFHFFLSELLALLLDLEKQGMGWVIEVRGGCDVI